MSKLPVFLHVDFLILFLLLFLLALTFYELILVKGIHTISETAKAVDVLLASRLDFSSFHS